MSADENLRIAIVSEDKVRSVRAVGRDQQERSYYSAADGIYAMYLLPIPQRQLQQHG